LHKVYWNFRGRATPVRGALGPSQLRDSTNLARRITVVFDSVGRGGTVPQASLDRMKNALLSGNVGAAGGRGGGGGGGGGRGAAGPAATPAWIDRPGEGTEIIGGRGRGGGGGGAGADPFAEFPGGAEALAVLLRPRGAPAFAGRGGGAGEIGQRLSALTGGGGGGRGGGGGGFGGGAGPLVPPGDYLVTLTVGGQSYRQKLRVERLDGFGEMPK
jgi:hypothetical protein